MRARSVIAVLALVVVAALVFQGCKNSSSPAGGGGENNTDTTPPAVTITSPLEGSVLPSLLDISGTATDDTEVDTVFFEVRDLCGNPLWSDYDILSPYEEEWDASGAMDGAYRVCMAAVDPSGNMSAWTCVTVSKGTVSAQITGFFPFAAYRGREITVKGTGFGTTTGAVTVFSRDAVVNDWTDSTVAFVIPDLIPENSIVPMELLIDCRWRVQGNIDITSPGVIRMTDHNAEDRWPCWDAGCNYIYFSSARSGNWDVWRISIDGKELEQVTVDQGFDAMPAIKYSTGEKAWVSNRNHLGHNPDGDYDIFTGFSCGGPELCSMGILTYDNDTNNNPSWARTVYMGYDLLYTQYWDEDDDGTTIPTIFMHSTGGTDSIGEGMEGCFSYDGHWVVYQDRDNRIRKKEVGTSTPIVLTRGFNDSSPHWGWANDKIVFTRYESGYYGIFVMDSDGSNVRALISNHGIMEQEPSWSNDCTKIVFTAHRFSNFDIYVYEVP